MFGPESCTPPSHSPRSARDDKDAPAQSTVRLTLGVRALVNGYASLLGMSAYRP